MSNFETQLETIVSGYRTNQLYCLTNIIFTIMKKLTFLFSMLIALVGMNANAAMYIIGNNPFGGWDPTQGVEMTELADGTYTLDATFTEPDVWFIFAEAVGTWEVVNPVRYDCGNPNNDLVVYADTEFTPVAGNSGKSFKFSGTVGEKYTFTFNPTTMKAKVSGYVEPVTEFTYTVAGGNADIFGTAWAPGETANDMTLDPADGLYKLAKDSIEIAGGYTLEYKVCQNHGWGTNWGATPNGANQTYTFNEGGTYNLVFIFDLVNEAVSLEATKIEEGPAIDPITGDFFILGQVNDNNWNPSTGIQMATIDEDVYTLNDATFADSGDGYAYFSFTSKLGADENDWSFAAYRRGAVEDGTLVEDGVNAVLADWGSGNNAFKVLPGIYDVEVALSSNYVKLTYKGGPQPPEPYTGNVYILGEVNDNGGWFTNKGVLMTRDAENNLYTATITTLGENVPEGEEVGYSYFSFTKQLADSAADWDAIAPYRFGAVSEGDYWVTEEVLGTLIPLKNNGNSFRVPAGTWNLTLSVDNMTLVIEAVAEEVLRGDVNGDKTVSIADVTALIDYLLSHDASLINVNNADCNLDNGISIADVTALIDYLLSKEWPAE